MHAGVFFLNQLRQARAAVLRDAEAVDSLIQAFERLGMLLLGRLGALGDYKGVLGTLAGHSTLARQASEELHIPFGELFESVREARNSAMHEGAHARHLASHAVKMALILEDALMNGSDGVGKSTALNLVLKNAPMKRIGDFMVPNPVCAETWQPLSFIRQTMLTNSFSYLPVNTGTEAKPSWQLVSDTALAQYLRLRSDGTSLKDLMVQSLDEAKKAGLSLSTPAGICPWNKAVRNLLTDLAKWDGRPVLVTRQDTTELLGILMPEDLL